MATMTVARSIFRSTSARRASAKFASASKSSSPHSSFRTTTPKNSLSSHRIFRCPAELSASLETMQPFHTATASALMNSELWFTRLCHAWVPDDK